MKITNQNKILLFFGLLSVALVAGFFLLKSQKEKESAAVIAIGLRGTSKVTKPLSALQQERLQKHFMTMPISAHNNKTNVVNEVQSINEFNARQTE